MAFPLLEPSGPLRSLEVSDSWTEVEKLPRPLDVPVPAFRPRGAGRVAAARARREAGSQVDMEELMESGGSSGAERRGSLEPGSSLAAGQPAGECPAGGASEATAQDIIAPATSLHAAAVLEMSLIREEEDSSAEDPWQHSGPWLEASRHRRGVERDRQSWWSSSDDDAKYWENWWTWPTVENYVVQNYPAENYEDQSSERHSVQSDWSDESFGQLQ